MPGGGWRLYPAYDSRNLSLIYSPVLLKLPVLRPHIAEMP